MGGEGRVGSVGGWFRCPVEPYGLASSRVVAPWALDHI